MNDRVDQAVIQGALMDELRRLGYRIIREPGPGELPISLRSFRPNYIATRGMEGLVIEVRSRDQANTQTQLDELASATENTPGWNLELIWLGEESDPEVPEREISSLIDRALKVEKLDAQAGLLLMWVAVEGALERLANRSNVDINRKPAPRLITELYSLGILSDSFYSQLIDAWRIRTSIAHFRSFKGDETRNINVQQLSILVGRLVSDDYVAVDQMVDWFLENYEDPAISVPYDSAEGGYQYGARGPYDAQQVLSERFPSALESEIEEAVQKLENVSTEWVTKQI